MLFETFCQILPYLTPCNADLIQTALVLQLLKKLPVFMEREGLLPCLQHSAAPIVVTKRLYLPPVSLFDR